MLRDMDAAQLTAFAPALRDYLAPLERAIIDAALNTPQRLHAFLAQWAHETQGFTQLSENLNYSADGLLKIFPRHFPYRDIAEDYARRPESIANRVYAGRYGNGGESSGDGWRFRGRGWPHVTFRRNYAACSVFLFRDPDTLLQQPELLEQREHAVGAAVWYWRARNLNAFADVPGNEAFESLSRAINGGTNGLEDRMKWWHWAQYHIR